MEVEEVTLKYKGKMVFEIEMTMRYDRMLVVKKKHINLSKEDEIKLKRDILREILNDLHEDKEVM